MELTLNCLWLLISLLGFGLWWRRGLSGKCSRAWRGSFQSTLALACAAAFLLPVISVSDDLHGEQAAMEDSSSSRREFKRSGGNSNFSSHSRVDRPFAPSVLTASFSLNDPHVKRISTAESSPQTAIAADSILARAPPLLL